MVVNLPGAIILHHSATDDGPADHWQAIRRYHMEERGWRDIGYHYGVERVGDRVVVQYGREPHVQGAHAKGHNRNSLGVCMVGNFQEHRPPPEILDATVQLLKALMRVYDLEPRQFLGHREIMPPGYTECPGRAVDMVEIREILASGLAAGRMAKGRLGLCG